MAITDWPENERPRERLLQHGAAALSDAELLAIFLRVGIKGASAVDLARTLLNHFGTLNRLFSASAEAFSTIPGMGDAKYAQLQAVLELARRALREEIAAGNILSSPRAVRDWLRLTLATLPHEVFMVLLLDAQNRLLAAEELFRGTLTQTSVYPRQVALRALHHHAAAVVLAHNHPGGSVQPSRADEVMTQTLQAALTLLDVRVIDHIIVAPGQTLSMSDKGLL
jgi:DNA repair protein RadC